MIKNKTPLTMHETVKMIGELPKTDKTKELEIFIKKFAGKDAKAAAKLKEELNKLNIVKLKESDIVKIVDVLPESATELNKVFSDTSLDVDETTKVLDAIKNIK